MARMDKTLSQIQAKFAGRNLGSGALFGVGLAAFLDEAVFHQLLHWHHFYDLSTTAAGLVSDGLFHAFSWFATVVALFMLADLRRRAAWWRKRWMSGVMLGSGGFNFYDGTIQHKLMRIHQIRYEVEILPYDLAWNAIALFFILLGTMLFLKTNKQLRRAGAAPDARQ
ncbi:DUF2243 domain-containing protein [Bacillus infantis]|uniref:DUF2243 domain-containing protein n=1 Tax=Bacillus infantis TaxID=324767 RepID=UPI003AFAA30B